MKKVMWLLVGLLLVAVAFPAFGAEPAPNPCLSIPEGRGERGLEREGFLFPLDLFSYLRTIRFSSSISTDRTVNVWVDRPIGLVRISPLPVDQGRIEVAVSTSRFFVESRECLSVDLRLLDLPVQLYFTDQTGREYFIPAVQIELRGVRVVPAAAGAEVALRLQAVSIVDQALAALQDAAGNRVRIEVIPVSVALSIVRDRENEPLIRALQILVSDAEVIPIATPPSAPPCPPIGCG